MLVLEEWGWHISQSSLERDLRFVKLRKVRLARAGRADAEGDVVRSNVLQVQVLRGRAAAQVGAAGGQDDRVLGRIQQLAVARQHELQVVFRDWAIGHLVERLQQLQGLRGLGLGAVHLELFMPVRDAHRQGSLDGAQMRIGRTAHVGEARVVVGSEGVAQDHADNSSRQKSQ